MPGRGGTFTTPTIRAAPGSARVCQPSLTCPPAPTARAWGWGLRDVCTLPLSLFPTVGGKTETAGTKRGAARNSIWCLSVSALSSVRERVTLPAARQEMPPLLRPPQAGALGRQETQSARAGVEGEGRLGP